MDPGLCCSKHENSDSNAGIYLLARDAASVDDLKKHLQHEVGFSWTKPQVS